MLKGKDQFETISEREDFELELRERTVIAYERIAAALGQKEVPQAVFASDIPYGQREKITSDGKTWYYCSVCKTSPVMGEAHPCTYAETAAGGD